MIQGQKRITLTPEAILNLVSAYDIFRFYMPDHNWRVNQVTLSPFPRPGRGIEKNPSFLIGTRGGDIHFIDYADSSKRGDAFTFVKLLHNMISMDDVLKMIDKDFGLGISSKSLVDYKKIVSEYKQPEELGKRYSLIQCVTQKFTNEELKYWSDYHQSLEDLRTNNIYSIKELYLNKCRFPLRDNELRFGYLYEGGWWKIYMVEREKKRKWLSNVPLTTTYGLNNLQLDKNTLICKSLKDYLVCRKVYEHVCHIQNESLAAFSHETVDYINEHSCNIFYGGDSDEPGKKASYNITNAFGFKHINSPDRLLPEINDFAGWGKLEGLLPLEQHFKLKGLII